MLHARRTSLPLTQSLPRHDIWAGLLLSCALRCSVSAPQGAYLIILHSSFGSSQSPHGMLDDEYVNHDTEGTDSASVSGMTISGLGL